MKKLLLLSAFSLFVATAAQAAQPVPAPKIVVIDRGAILQYSKVGQDLGRQLQAMSNQAKTEFANRAKALQAEQAAMQQQIAILSADAKQKRIDAFAAKERALDADVQNRQAQLQNALQQAQNTVAQALQPIVAQLVQERGANMVLDKTAVVFANNGAFDITKDSITRLDAKLTSLKLSLGGGGPAKPKK